jgi:hypothetical protein
VLGKNPSVGKPQEDEMAEKEPHYGEEEGQESFYGEDEASGKGKSTGQGRDTATRTTQETGAEPGGQAEMRPTGSGGSATPEE